MNIEFVEALAGVVWTIVLSVGVVALGLIGLILIIGVVLLLLHDISGNN